MRRVYLLLLGVSLLGCSRHDYVTWQCTSPEQINASEKPLTMILDRTEMRIQKDIYYFCGSLGHQSFFSKQCPAVNAESPIRFTPKTGDLEIRQGSITNTMKCESL
ncbi:MAG: hypothetical protein EBS31_00895 [Burkholderiaceae bacterium]|jgi:hypothetical protein|nr:hypothetical protein [Burkholderiaceae bacterium]